MTGEGERDFAWLGPLAPIVRPIAIYDQARARAEAADDGVPVRSAPTAPAVDYRAIPHDELHAMVNTEVDPGAVDAAADLWLRIGDDL
ncbi:MAG: hypothetical protein HOV94_25380, partial [Saccharothrix sp.]|nr:hypothetical protein [Saccharothrix sp.]